MGKKAGKRDNQKRERVSSALPARDEWPKAHDPITFLDFVRIIETSPEVTPELAKEVVEAYQGTRIRWTGEVSEITPEGCHIGDESEGSSFTMGLPGSNTAVVCIFTYRVPEECLALVEGRRIEVSGLLSGFDSHVVFLTECRIEELPSELGSAPQLLGMVPLLARDIVPSQSELQLTKAKPAMEQQDETEQQCDSESQPGEPEQPADKDEAGATLVDRWITIIKNRPVLAAIVLLSLAVVALGTLTNSLKDIGDFFQWVVPDEPTITHLEFTKIEAIRQQVNQPEDEEATFRVQLHNSGEKTVTITKGDLRIEDVAFHEREARTMLRIELIDHTGHDQVRLDGLAVGKSFLIKPDIVVPAGSWKDFHIWLRLPDTQKPVLGFQEVTATLTLYGEDGGSVTSEPFTASIYTYRHKDR